jgi:hypothetical protein
MGDRWRKGSASSLEELGVPRWEDSPSSVLPIGFASAPGDQKLFLATKLSRLLGYQVARPVKAWMFIWLHEPRVSHPPRPPPLVATTFTLLTKCKPGICCFSHLNECSPRARLCCCKTDKHEKVIASLKKVTPLPLKKEMSAWAPLMGEPLLLEIGSTSFLPFDLHLFLHCTFPSPDQSC